VPLAVQNAALLGAREHSEGAAKEEERKGRGKKKKREVRSRTSRAQVWCT
jgi:hypothetical protein